MEVDVVPIATTDRLDITTFSLSDTDDRHVYQGLEDVAR